MSFCLPTACQEILQRYKIAFHLVKQWLPLLRRLGSPQAVRKFYTRIANKMHNVNEINVLHFSIALAANLRAGLTYEPPLAEIENMP